MTSPANQPLPALARDTTADHPWPVRHLAAKVTEYVNKMTPVWVEGQIVQFNRRPGADMSFLTLRDLVSDASFTVAAYTRALPADSPIREGDQVVVWAKPTFWPRRGSLQLEAREVRAVGVGQLLARIEQLKRMLAAEGLFAPERKVPLPFLPRAIGLVCGRESKAEHDVVVNAQARWPGMRFEIREVAVQGRHAVPEVGAAIQELDAMPDIDVIVVARGGGSVEDLLPFSDEGLVRLAANCRTPLVSAIGHETDNPLLDLVADYRASTPTDAAKRIVPDAAAEAEGLSRVRHRLQAALIGTLAHRQAELDALRSRPALARPQSMVDAEAAHLAAARDRAGRALAASLSRAESDIRGLRATVRALSPAATLERGYAVIQRADGAVVRSFHDVAAGQTVLARLAEGRLVASVSAAVPANGHTARNHSKDSG